MEWIITALTYALPTGFLVSLATWLVNRKVFAAKGKKDEQNAFVEMYNELKKLLEDESAEKNRLYRAVSKLERAVSLIGNCKHVDNCPVRHELRKQEAANERPIRLNRRASHRTGDTDAGAGGEGGDGDSDPVAQ